jgi:hypothetical protein
MFGRRGAEDRGRSNEWIPRCSRRSCGSKKEESEIVEQDGLTFIAWFESQILTFLFNLSLLMRTILFLKYTKS